MAQSPAPEFGENGAILNSAAMTDELREDYLKSTRIRRQLTGWPLAALVILYSLITLFIAIAPDHWPARWIGMSLYSIVGIGSLWVYRRAK